MHTPEDFGSQGALPSHPELLDWLAVDFMESGWDIKALLKKMVMSAAYRRSARISDKNYRIDPENVFLARGPAHRLTAEMIRDQALAVGGLLVSKVGGPWVKPYQPAGVWKELANQIGENKYRQSGGKGLFRRSLYSYWKRTIPPPSMLTFDAAERTVCVVKRQHTSTPLQSLVLLNDPQYIEASRALARRMMEEAGSETEHQIRYGFKLLNSREPQAEEIAVLMRLYKEEWTRFSTDPAQAEAILQVGSLQRDHTLDPAVHAALTIVANTLFNLDEAKMKS